MFHIAQFPIYPNVVVLHTGVHPVSAVSCNQTTNLFRLRLRPLKRHLLSGRSRLLLYSVYCIEPGVLCLCAGDDRNIVKVFVAGREVKKVLKS